MPGIDDVRNHGDDASLGDLLLGLLRFYRQFGRLLIPVAVLLALAAGVLVALFPLYRVGALLDTPRMTLEEWRRLQPMLSDRQLVADSVAAAGLPPALRERVQRRFLQPLYWQTRVQYRSAVERDDIRQQVNIDPKTVGALGLEVMLDARDETSATQQLQVIARHVRQVVLWGGLRDALEAMRQQTLEKRPELQIAQIQQQFAIEQNTQKITEMQALLERYPELRRSEVNTVVSVDDGGGKYLSPLAQIVALQATITETRADLRQGQRELEQLDWKRRFLACADRRAGTLHSGQALASWLQACRTAVFGDAAETGSARRQVVREIDLTLAQKLGQSQQVRYRALPALSATPVPTRHPLLVAAVVFAGSLLAMSLGLGVYVAARRLRDRSAWSAQRDPLFAWLPAALRRRLLPEDAPRRAPEQP
ncbi:hypothetical protein [Xanthomonas indica]|uniref:Chain length determinant protein n=1 Tax=Xanthomonas indica TaxID=2912242 RepID=A0AAU8I8X8_9XANT|nr:hypothetical protein [Xanthomonas indica]MCI2261523.1 hypothetical protein [Xanthomonas indica]